MELHENIRRIFIQVLGECDATNKMLHIRLRQAMQIYEWCKFSFGK